MIEKETFEEICKVQGTIEEICSYLGTNEYNLFKWIRLTYRSKRPQEIIEKFRDAGKLDLRKIQFVQASKNPVMAIWLGKQYLGQKDIIENNNVENIVFKDDVKKD